MCTKCNGLIQAQKYSYLCIILATGSQNLGSFNRRLSEVISTQNITVTDYAIAMFSLFFMFRICFDLIVLNVRNTWLKSVNF